MPAVERKYIKPTAVDSPTVGNLYAARERSKRLNRRINELREAIRKEPLGGNRSELRLDLLRANSAHAASKLDEAQCLAVIERRANELGLTTIGKR